MTLDLTGPPPSAAARADGRRSTPAWLLVAGLVVAALALLPLAFVATYAVLVGPADAWDLVVRPRVGRLLWNTVRLAGGAMLVCAVLGVGLAWLVERTDVPLRNLWHGLLVAPLAVPAFVNSYAWVSLDSGIGGYRRALLVICLSYFPLVYLPTVAALRGLDPAHEEAAWSLGHDRLQTFVRVVLPQLRPAVLGGTLLVGLHLLAEFGALQMLQFPTFTTAIYDLYGSTFNGAAANMIAGVLVLCCLLLLVGELRLRGHRPVARIGQGAARAAVTVRLGLARWPATAALAALVGLAGGVPLLALAHWLRVGSSTRFPLADLAEATATTALLAALGAATTVLLAIPVAWLVVRHPGRASTLIERSTFTAHALPGIVVALAFVTISLRVVPSVYQTAVLLVAAYAVLFLPRAVVTVRAGLQQVPVVLDDVAHSLGARPVAAALRVTLPIMGPSLGAGAALVFLAIGTELTATLMLSPIGTATLATSFWSASTDLRYGAAAPYALLLVLTSVPATILLMRHERLRP